jgi:hypothetical protein
VNGSLYPFRKRGFVWNRLANGLRAYGLDFGRFALVILVNGKDGDDGT